MTNQELANALLRLEAKVDAMKTTLDELTGAKKILFALTAIVSAAITSVATFIGVHHK